jgi:sulfite reductase alpha subunit-like flavoprotein
LPRFIDKIRLARAGELHSDYQPNYLHKGFDAKWLETVGLEAEEFVTVVNNTITDGQVVDWIRENVEVDEATRDLFNDAVGNYGSDEANTELRQRLVERKKEAGMGDRDDVQCFVDFIDADEGRI